MPDIDRINSFLQDQLARRSMSEVSAVEAGEWLDRAGILRDSASRPGKPLRDLLRARRIIGQRQDLDTRWFIERRQVSEPRPVTDANAEKILLDPEKQNPLTEHVLPDLLIEELKVVFVGTAVGDVSAARKHYYSDPRNCFYSLFYASGIAPVLLRPEDDRRLLEFAGGLTDLAKRVHTSDDAALTADVLRSGLVEFEEKIRRYKPNPTSAVRPNKRAFLNVIRGKMAQKSTLQLLKLDLPR